MTSPPRPRDRDDSRAGLRADATRLGGVESLVLRSGVSAPHSGGAELETGSGENLQSKDVSLKDLCHQVEALDGLTDC